MKTEEIFHQLKFIFDFDLFCPIYKNKCGNAILYQEKRIKKCTTKKNDFYLMKKKKKDRISSNLIILCVGIEPSQNAKVECVFLDITVVVDF